MTTRQFATLALLLALPSVGLSADLVLSADQACDVLKGAAIRYHLAAHELTGRYYCDHAGDLKGYFYLGLRYEVNPSELVGSNLLGWFAVRRTDGKLFRWNTENDELAEVTE